MTAADPSGLHPSTEAAAPLLPFGAMLLHAASAEACPPPRYRHCAPLIPIKFGYTAILTRIKPAVNGYTKKYSEKTGGHRRLPVTFRTAPPMNLGSRMHTILTRMLSPPASADEHPSRTDERCARHGRPGPARDAQEEQQQPGCNEHAAQQLPQTVFRHRALCRIVRQIPDSAHPASPASLAGYAIKAKQMHPPSAAFFVLDRGCCSVSLPRYLHHFAACGSPRPAR